MACLVGFLMAFFFLMQLDPGSLEEPTQEADWQRNFPCCHSCPDNFCAQIPWWTERSKAKSKGGTGTTATQKLFSPWIYDHTTYSPTTIKWQKRREWFSHHCNDLEREKKRNLEEFKIKRSITKQRRKKNYIWIKKVSKKVVK